MSDLMCAFFATEDGEPWCAFAWGQHPPALVATAEIRARVLREAEPFDFDDETNAEIAQAMSAAPANHWIRPDGMADDADMFQFCAEGDPGARPITGWKLR